MEPKTIQLKLTTLTPVHIGSGRVLSYNTEYLNFPKEGVCAVIDEQKVLKIIGHENIDKWVALIDNQEDLLDYLKTRKPELKPEDVAKRIIQGKVPQNNRQGLREQMFTGNGRPLLPGSSLKGPMRTAALNHHFGKQYVQQEQVITNKRLLYNDQIDKFIEKDLQKEAFYPNAQRGKEANEDVFRFLQIADAMPHCDTEVYPGVLLNYNIGRNEWQHDNRSMHLMEVIPAEITTPLSLKLSEHLTTNKSPFSSIKQMFSQINEATNASLDFDMQDIEENGNEERDVLLERYEQLMNLTSEADTSCECIMRVGMGSGWLFMTGGWPYDADLVEEKAMQVIRQKVQGKEYPEDSPFPKTRKLLEGGTPLGFVKLEKVD